MDYRLDDAIPLLRRTPHVLAAWLLDLPDAWLLAREGDGTWSPGEVVGHLVHAEREDWITRIDHLLAHGERTPFPPFVRDAMLREPERPLREQLDTFEALRAASLTHLIGLGPTDADLHRTGRHPEFGPVTLGQLLATWVAHDLTHISQISRTLARQYEGEVGPWRAYLSVLAPRR